MIVDETFLYRTMRLIRTTEEQLARLHARGLVHGACHTYVGEEAIATGVCAHLRADDAIFSTHRGHGHALAKGMPPHELIAELLGRSTGCSRGRGGSMHLFSPEIGMMGTSGIVGPCILQAAGAGYSFQLLATEVAFQDVAGNPDVASRAAGYGMVGVQLDGNDVGAIAKAAGEAVARARTGGGPTLLECKTYRTRPHAEGMGDYTYRTREEVAGWRQRCPIQRYKAALVESGEAAAADFDAVDAEVNATVVAASDLAEKAPWPEPREAAEHVYASGAADAVRAEPGDAAGAGREISFTAATLEALDHEMGLNPGIFVLGEGIGVRGGNFGTTVGLFAKYGARRLRDSPICERGFVGLACGAGMTGTRPIVDFMFIDFINDAFGELINQIAKMQYMSSGRLKMPVLLRGCIGIGHSAATHHSGSYQAIYSHIPGLRVVVPSTPYDAKGLFLRALRCDDPVLFLEPRELLSVKGPVPADFYEIEFGKARIRREGTQVTAVAIGEMVPRTLAAAKEYAAQGISVEVLDPRTVSPLDTAAILTSVRKTGRLLVVDESFGPCGLASEIAAQVAGAGFDDLDAPIHRLHGVFAPTPYSPTLEAAMIPNAGAIAAAIRDLVNE